MEELHQAVESVARAVWPTLYEHDAWREGNVLARLVEPDRMIQFRVEWESDDGKVHVERGYRVQQSRTLGPYKGGLRFSRNVNLGVIRFLAFEQALKDALTGLPLGGAKGGATFDPHGRSEAEVRRFCRSFMDELQWHIGPDHDVPAGDIGVGEREIGFLYGAYQRRPGVASGGLTGKNPAWGGIPLRVEATGHGLLYFVRLVLEQRDETLEGKRCAISGAGNVALHAAEKAIELGATVVSLSNSGGSAVFDKGLQASALDALIKATARGQRLEDVVGKLGGDFDKGTKPWEIPNIEVALPCATQNELDEGDALKLAKSNSLQVVAEGANMPCTASAVRVIREAGIAYAPGKAANAGGVAVSGLEMAQNAQRLPWTRDEVDAALQERMAHIHDQCVEHSPASSPVDYDVGANVAAFSRLANARLALG